MLHNCSPGGGGDDGKESTALDEIGATAQDFYAGSEWMKKG